MEILKYMEISFCAGLTLQDLSVYFYKRQRNAIFVHGRRPLGQHIIQSLTQYTLNLLNPLPHFSLNTLILVLHELTDVG